MKRIVPIILCFAFILTGCGNSNILKLNGTVQNNIVTATTTVTGKIIEMNKTQGEEVKKGDVLAVIDNVNQKYTVDQLQAVANAKKANLEELQRGARPEQIEQAKAQVRAAKAQYDLLVSGNRNEQIEQAKNGVSVAEQGVKTAQVSYDYINAQYQKVVKLSETGSVSQNDIDDAKYKLDTSANQLATVKYQLETAKQQLALIESGSTTQSIEAAKANYDAAKAAQKLLESGSTEQTIAAAKAGLEQAEAQLNSAKNTLDNCTITALADGIIISKNYELGDVATAGSSIADIAVANDLYVVTYIPDKYLDKISYNQELNVITSLGIKKGKVSYIALEHEYTPKDEQSTTDTHIATKMKVAIKDDTSGKLKSGMLATVEVPVK